MLIAIPIALLVFYVVNPPLWHDPAAGIAEHFKRNLNRAVTLNIQTVFLGEVYDVGNPLPWYNTLAWLVMVAPVPTLVFGMVGLWHSLIKPTPWTIALFLNWITMMIVRALPGAPPHDGVRLFLPALGFWCVYAGIGAQVAFDAFGRIHAKSWKLGLQAALVLAFVTNVVDLVRYYPQTLSHYSPIVGGLRGAEELGMEPAYWWDALDADVLRWINERTTPGEAIAFSPIYNTAALHLPGLLKPKNVEPGVSRFQWYVLQNRPGLFSRVDRTLMRRGEPAFVKYAGRAEGSTVPRDMEIPLISIFSFDQSARARRR
jgi:hypothetical protein